MGLKTGHFYHSAWRRVLLFLGIFCFFPFVLKANNFIGGDITWECNGAGDFVFRLTIVQDCDPTAVPMGAQQIAVWNHPTLSTVTVHPVSSTLSVPTCTQVAGSPAPLQCDAAVSGTSEMVVFESLPFSLTGTPPAAGWIFTWDQFSRNNTLTNVVTPDQFGITLRSIMYSNGGGSISPCSDSSPQFTGPVDVLWCANQPHALNVNAYDVDQDSLVYSFGQPLDEIKNPPIFNPPSNPAHLPFTSGFSAVSPTPNASFDPTNQPASIHPYTGEITFRSNTHGNFLVTVKVESYRCGIKLAEVYREFQLTVIACGGTNTPPTVAPPFLNGMGVGVFYDTVYAGDLVTFPVSATDLELLHDGVSPQSLRLDVSGEPFGTNAVSSTTGCSHPPCATMSNSMPANGSQGVSSDFSWQTSCDHVSNQGCQTASSTYNFVFRVSDDYCAVPGVTVATVNITVLGTPQLPSPQIHCADVQTNGDVVVTWEPVVNQLNSFVEYRIYASTGGPFNLIGTETDATVGAFTHLGAGANGNKWSYYVRTVSGCGPSEALETDTLSTIFLDVVNPGNGTAVLNWEDPSIPTLASSSGQYLIYKEHPIGVWNLIDSISISEVDFYIDTITTCGDSLSYQLVVLDDLGCSSHSTIDGDFFEDKLPPNKPIIQTVSVDTSTNQAQITWGANPAEDTDGYIIFQQDILGTWFILDTIYGRGNTTYQNLLSAAGAVSEVYGVAAFDSCLTGTPPTPNTSPMGQEHHSIFLEGDYSVCDRNILLTWNEYMNWTEGIDRYELYVSLNNGPYSLESTFTVADDRSYLFENMQEEQDYCFFLKGYSTLSKIVLSNKRCLRARQPKKPDFLYVQAVSVKANNSVDIRIHVDPTASARTYDVYRRAESEMEYTFVTSLPAGTTGLFYTDLGPTPQNEPFLFRVQMIDSCGRESVWSDSAQTIFLKVQKDPNGFANYLSWTPYMGWKGSVVEYRIYRGVDGVFDPVPIGSVPGGGARLFTDDVSSFIGTNAKGAFCYYVEAVENTNLYGFSELANSNVACSVQEELLYIPNAFVVGGINSIFQPKASFIDFSAYHLEVFARNGVRVFESFAIDDGWNGDFNGSYCRAGVYVYKVTYITGEGREVQQVGHVTLIR